MCGIAGIAGFGKESGDRLLREMVRRIEHRGPDAEGFYAEEDVALGHRRLSIIDLSSAANQPLADRDGRYVITFNGEIYNYREVRAQLHDYDFATNSDTETIVAAYARYGANCLNQLNGMFAFAIWDTRSRELFIARDRLGVKPLYYFEKEGSLFFASEIRALLETGEIPRTIDRDALRDYVQFQSVYSPATIVEGVRQLPAGTFARFAGGKLNIERYWDVAGDPTEPPESDPAAVRSRVRDLFRASIERRMISDVRLGAFLSGGIDSSAVVAMMSECGTGPVNTFSVGFDEPEFDESGHALTVARRFGTEHTCIRLRAADFLEQLPDALRAADSPSGDGVNTFVVSKATRNAGLKVALSGLGGDELFAGYPNFMKWFKFRRGIAAASPAVLRKAAGAVLSLSQTSKLQRIGALLEAGSIDISTFYPKTREVLSQKWVEALMKGSHGCSRIESELGSRRGAIERFPLLSQFSIGEMLGYTQNVLLKDADQFSMASALEVREPFFDYELVEYVLRIPDEIKRPAYPKSLLVESLAPLLPESVVHRPKMGFVLPWKHWMRNELREFCEKRIRNIADAGILDPKALSRLWESFLAGRDGVLWSHVWHIVVLSDWLAGNGFIEK